MSLDVTLYIDVDTGGEGLTRVELFSANITHNLGKMAVEAGIYNHLWHHEEVGAKHAGDIIDALDAGLTLMKADPDHFEQFNASNGWGLYEHFVPWVKRYLEACREHPKAIIGVWR